MKVALISAPWYPVPPVGYGGIELVVALLDRGLRQRGHDVLTIGAEGSADHVVKLAPRAWREDLGRGDGALREFAYLGRVFRMLQGMVARGDRFDVIHDHSGMGGVLAAEMARLAPSVHTVHGPIWEPQRTAYECLADHVGLVSISHNQRESAPELPWVGTVHNAVDVEHLIVGRRDEKEPYLLVLARVCADKGQHLAIEVGKRLGMRVVMAGKVETTPAGLEYFEKRVHPHIDGHKVVHIPNVAGREKAELLAHAEALLSPITWPEPFGLSMVEAMVSGTPVIALNHGAASELIDDGETGFVVRDMDAMCEAVIASREIDPLRCGQRARDRFAPQAMVKGYLEIYDSVARGVVPPIKPYLRREPISA